jgi:hypothetical protein
MYPAPLPLPEIALPRTHSRSTAEAVVFEFESQINHIQAPRPPENLGNLANTGYNIKACSAMTCGHEPSILRRSSASCIPEMPQWSQ